VGQAHRGGLHIRGGQAPGRGRRKYKIDWTKAWGGTLLKLGTESKGVADGVADIAIVSTIFEAAKFPLQNVTYYTPFGSDDVGVINQTCSSCRGPFRR